MRFRPWGTSGLTIGLASILPMGLAAVSLFGAPPGENPNPSTPPAGQSDGQPDNRAGGPRPDSDESPDRLRQRARDFLNKTIDSWKPRLDRMERALKLLDDGAPMDQVRAAFPEAARPGSRFADWRDRLGGGPAGEEADPGQRPGNDGRRADAGGPGRGPGEPGAESALTDDQRAFVKEFLKANNPVTWHQYEELEHRDAEAAKRRISDMWPRVRWLWDLRKRDADLYQLHLDEIRIRHQALEYSVWIAKHDMAGKPETDADRKTHMAELDRAVHEQFAVRTRIMAHELVKLRERVEQTQHELDNRTVDEPKVIAESTRTMLQEGKERAERRGKADRKGGDPGKPAPNAPPPAQGSPQN